MAAFSQRRKKRRVAAALIRRYAASADVDLNEVRAKCWNDLSLLSVKYSLCPSGSTFELSLESGGLAKIIVHFCEQPRLVLQQN